MTTLQSTLALLSAEYIKGCLNPNNNIESELVRLNAAGLSSCTNYRVLSSMTHDITKETLIKDIKKAYPQALIVPYVDFFRVMKEYNLAVGRIKHYTKIIPEENINQICDAAEALKHLCLNQMLYVSRLRIDADMPKAAVKFISSYIARFPLIPSDYSFTAYIPYQNKLDEMINRHYDDYSMFTNRLDQNDWLIAAPVADLPENTTIEVFSGRVERRKRIIEDPIVFKASAIGAVIVSMWGEEADSSIFDKYR